MTIRAKNPNCFACGSDQIDITEGDNQLVTTCRECGAYDMHEPIEGLNHTRMTGRLIRD